MEMPASWRAARLETWDQGLQQVSSTGHPRAAPIVNNSSALAVLYLWQLPSQPASPVPGNAQAGVTCDGTAPQTSLNLTTSFFGGKRKSIRLG